MNDGNDLYVDEGGHIVGWPRERGKLTGGWTRVDKMSVEMWVAALRSAQESRGAWYLAFMNLAILPALKRLSSWRKFVKKYEDMGFGNIPAQIE